MDFNNNIFLLLQIDWIRKERAKETWQIEISEHEWRQMTCTAMNRYIFIHYLFSYI